MIKHGLEIAAKGLHISGICFLASVQLKVDVIQAHIETVGGGEPTCKVAEAQLFYIFTFFL